MEGEEGVGLRLSKRFNGGKPGTGEEVDYKTKAGTAWSHSYLNQKPWHPLSYPNQRRKWIAEQTHAHRQRRNEEVAREYAQEQEFFRQTALISKKEKEKIEMMQAVSFMYVRPPGYNAESAKAAEVEDERNKLEQDIPSSSSKGLTIEGLSSTMDHLREGKKKPRPKDVFGCPLPTEEEFAVLKNAPRLETGLPARVKPFAIEVRNVKCVRCGNFGHQSGDRECLLKDAIMPNEESRLKRDDPLTTIMAQVHPSEPLKWELKQKPGMSPPRGGFDPDNPNQQIVAEDIFDEYGGFLSGGYVPELLTNFSPGKLRKKSKRSKHKRGSSPGRDLRCPEENVFSSQSDREERRAKREKKKKKQKHKQNYSHSSSFDGSESDEHSKRSRQSHYFLNGISDSDKHHGRQKSGQKHFYSLEESDFDRPDKGNKRNRKHSTGGLGRDHRKDGRSRDKGYSCEDSPSDWRRGDKKIKHLRSHHGLSDGSDSDDHGRGNHRAYHHHPNK